MTQGFNLFVIQSFSSTWDFGLETLDCSVSYT